MKKLKDTNLVDQKVKFTNHPSNRDRIGNIARIRSVYIDSDGTPKYTVQDVNSGTLHECWAFQFVISI